MSESTMELSSAEASLSVDLANGGRLASLVVHGHELLRSGSGPDMQWGCFPMAPFAGRLADGRFTYTGVDYELARNLEPHAIHGTVFDRPWVQTSGETATIELSPRWPLGGRVDQRFDLRDEYLRLEISITAGDQTMPYSFGWHPWFLRTLDDGSEATLSVKPDAMYELDDRAIPTGQMVEPAPRPWDHCFTRLPAPPVLRWGDTLELRLTSSCTDWQIYTEPEDAICVEPQTAAPDSFNRVPDGLSPQQSVSAWYELNWSIPE